jgi:hypothetical protein
MKRLLYFLALISGILLLSIDYMFLQFVRVMVLTESEALGTSPTLPDFSLFSLRCCSFFNGVPAARLLCGMLLPDLVDNDSFSH